MGAPQVPSTCRCAKNPILYTHHHHLCMCRSFCGRKSRRLIQSLKQLSYLNVLKKSTTVIAIVQELGADHATSVVEPARSQLQRVLTLHGLRSLKMLDALPGER